MISLLPGFADPVLGSQSSFRATMNAFARPGTVATLADAPRPPTGLCAAAAAVLLTLADADTPIYLGGEARSPASEEFVTFHTGAALVPTPEPAAFAMVSAEEFVALCERFSCGDPQYPDRSATILLRVRSFEAGSALRLSGPGIETSTQVCVDGLPNAFETLWNRNRSLAPLGYDLMLVADDRLIGLPRSVRVEVV